MVIESLTVAILFSLVALLAAQRGRGPFATPAPWGEPSRAPRWAWWVAYLAAIAACGPILAGLPVLFADRPLLVADAASHAAIAQQIATQGLPHGWVDVYNGGFPFGIHYPSVGYLVVAGLIRAGLPTAHAMQAAGLAGTIALPVGVVRAARVVGARPAVGVLGAWVVAWIAPHNAFVGGWEQYLTMGLLAQTLALPIAVALVAALLSGGPTWHAPTLAGLLLATHPQVGTGTFAVLLPAVVAVRGPWRLRYARAGIAGAAVALAIFGHGLASLGVPFGFPSEMSSWKQVGFGPERLERFVVEGQLFDQERPPITSALWGVSCVWLAATSIRREVGRGVLLVSVFTLSLSVSGGLLTEMGRAGTVLLGFLMPLRLMALLPCAIAACVIVAAEEACFAITAPKWRWAFSTAMLLPPAALAFPARVTWAHDGLAVREENRRGGGSECGAGTPEGFSAETIGTWVRTVDRGRFSFQANLVPIRYCPGVHGVELESPVPNGMCFAAAAHAGTNATAFARLRPGTTGVGARAEALGVRAILFTGADRPLETEPFVIAHAKGEVGLAVRLAGTDTVGIGCVREVWTGSDAEVRSALDLNLRGEPCLLDSPSDLIVLERGTGPLERVPVERGECSVEGVTVEERRREPGAYEALIRAPQAVDVVVRATAYEGWQTTIDGQSARWRMVAPGFFAIRVPAGEHRVEAVTSLPRTFFPGLAAAALIVVAMGRGSWRRRPEDGDGKVAVG